MMIPAASSSAQRPNSCDHFTGKERDAETGLDYFLARYYSGAQGRFLSPDEFKGGIVDPFTGQQVSQPGPLPYADINNPQTLIKYAYVINNPLRFIDPDGHEEQASGSDKNKNNAIYTISYTTAAPGMLIGAIVGEFVDPLGGGVPGALLGSMVGIGANASYVPSTKSWFAGPTITFTPVLMGGQGGSVSSSIVPPGQNPNSIANGTSTSINYQPTPLTGTNVTKSPGSAPVAGPSVGTRVPVTLGASYNTNITKAVNAVASSLKHFMELFKKKD
jgi:RHS repeat-associated protein